MFVYLVHIIRMLRWGQYIYKNKFRENTDYIFVGKSVLKEKIKNLKYKDIEKDIIKVIKQWKKYYCF